MVVLAELMIHSSLIVSNNCQVWRISAVQQVILMFMFPGRAADVIRIDLYVITKKYPDVETS
jgi:hypothetical protein